MLREHLALARTESGVGRLTLDRLLKGVENDYKINALRSARVLTYRSKHLRDFFGGGCRASAITTDRLRDYATHRKREGASNASVNREFSLLRRGFRLASNVVGSVPVFPMLKEAPAREGFFESAEHATVVAALPEPYNRIWEVEHDTGWRADEVLMRQKSHVDLEHGWLNVDPGETKNGDGRKFPLMPRLREVIKAQLKWSRTIETRLETIVPWLWHDEKGQRIKYDRYYRKWRPVVPENRNAHDLRRTAARELSRTGISQPIAMKMLGHKTESIYRRYAIADEVVMQEAATMLAARQAGQAAAPAASKVVSIRVKRANRSGGRKA